MKSLKKLISLAMAATFLSTAVTSGVGASFNFPSNTQTQQIATANTDSHVGTEPNSNTQSQQTATTNATPDFVLLEDTELRKHYTEKIQIGNVTEDLNVILETTADFPFTQENAEFLRECVKGAIQKIYEKFNVYPKLNNIHIKIDDEECKKNNCAALYNLINNQVTIRQYFLGEKRNQLCSTLAHELTHKYLSEKLGHDIPNWFDEGIAMQHDFDSDYETNALDECPEWGKENFLFSNKYPSKENQSKFYSYNQHFLKKLLSENECSFEKLLKDIEEKIKLTKLCKNPIFFSCVMKNGGDKILESNNIDINTLYKEIRRDAIKKNIPLGSFEFLFYMLEQMLEQILFSPVARVALVILNYGGIFKILPTQFIIPFLVGDFIVARVINNIKSKTSPQEKPLATKSSTLKKQTEEEKKMEKEAQEKKPKKEKGVQEHSKKSKKANQKSGSCTLL